MLRISLHRILPWIVLFSVVLFQRSGISAPAPSHVYILTERSLARFELQTARRRTSVDLAREASRKVVAGSSFVFLQRKRSVDVLEDEKLKRVHVVELRDEIKDITAGGDLLVVATGPEERPGTVLAGQGSIHVFRVANDGTAKTVTELRVPKPVHDLLMKGSYLYAIDDVVTPVYAHYVDLQRPERARLSMISWDGVYAHFVSQAVADKWYVFRTHWSGPMNTGMTEAFLTLPLHPPLKFLSKVEARYPFHGHNAPAEFRVHSGFLYWADEGVDEMRLVRRMLNRVEKQSLAQLGSAIWPRPARKGTIELVGSRLYVAAHRELIGFDLNRGQRPGGFLRIPTPSRIISFALKNP
jgi:hypothetical protein